MHITFLGHCGFAVDTGPHILLFDYCPRRLKAQAEALLPGLLAGRAPLVFVSHRHRDHYCEDIYGLPAARYFVGAGTPIQKNAVALQGGEVLSFPDFQVQTFPSTDEGVAFLVRIDGSTIYHAGDLNWWYWPDEPDPWNPDMERSFCRQADQITQLPIDVAFLDADPRQREGWLYGFDYLMRQGAIRHAVPMHFWNQKSAPRKVREAPCASPYRERIVADLCACGDHTEIE